MVAQITLEDDANIEDIHKEIDKAKYQQDEPPPEDTGSSVA